MASHDYGYSAPGILRVGNSDRMRAHLVAGSFMGDGALRGSKHSADGSIGSPPGEFTYIVEPPDDPDMFVYCSSPTAT